MGVCSTAMTAVKLGWRAMRRVWVGRRARPRRVRQVYAVTGGRPGLARYAAVLQVGCDSRALQGEEMPEDCCQPPLTARLRRRISATIFFCLFCFKNKCSISIYVYPFVYISTANLYINLYCQTEITK